MGPQRQPPLHRAPFLHTWSVLGRDLTILAVCLVLILSDIRRAVAHEPPEYQLKASIVLDLLKYVSYPERSGTRSVLHVCVFGNSDVVRFFMDLNGKIVQGKPLLVHEYKKLGVVDVCDVVFVSQSSAVSEKKVLQAIGSRTVLTIGESDSFLRNGGILSFFRRGNGFSFRVSTARAGKQDLRIDSALLDQGVVE